MFIYHGTNNDFDEFNLDFIDTKRGLDLGPGIYFSSKRSEAKGYGKNILEFYLTPHQTTFNLMNADELDKSRVMIDKIIKQAPKETLETALSNWDENNDIAYCKLKDCITKSEDNLDLVLNFLSLIYRYNQKQLCENMVKYSQYDGIFQEKSESIHYVFWNVKKLNPIIEKERVSV